MAGGRSPALATRGDRYAAVGAMEAGTTSDSDSSDVFVASSSRGRIFQNGGLIMLGICIGLIATRVISAIDSNSSVARSAAPKSQRAADVPTGILDDEGMEEYDPIDAGEGTPQWFDQAEAEEEEAMNETTHEEEQTEEDKIALKELPLPACQCNGWHGKSDAYRSGAKPSDEALCMGPWGDPRGVQYCYPTLASQHDSCPVVMHKCNNTLAPPEEKTFVAEEGACLCAFDIDRTLTAKQRNKQYRGHCDNATVVNRAFDSAFGGGQLTLSALSSVGISATACGKCYVGIVSHGTARGTTDLNRQTIIEAIMTPKFKEIYDNNSDAKRWSTGSNGWSTNHFGYGSRRIHSPFVVRHGDTKKQWGVEGILEWYASKGVQIERHRVWFFDDRADNVLFFNGTGMNSRQISCGSRDVGGASKVGYCGARPEEIKLEPGNIACWDHSEDAGHPPAGHGHAHHGGGHRR